jgi:hypothetical protein
MPDEFPPAIAAVPPENTGPNLRTPAEPVRQRVRVTEASSGVPMPPLATRETAFTAPSNEDSGGGGGGGDGNGPTEPGYWRSVTDCDDNTFEVWTKT